MIGNNTEYTSISDDFFQENETYDMTIRMEIDDFENRQEYFYVLDGHIRKCNKYYEDHELGIIEIDFVSHSPFDVIRTDFQEIGIDCELIESVRLPHYCDKMYPYHERKRSYPKFK
jgi:hypothetical protein